MFFLKKVKLKIYRMIKGGRLYAFIITNLKIGSVLSRYISPGAGSRRYINPEVGVENFFYELNKRGVNYVVLRWFENLPKIDEGEDIDMFIDDYDISLISDLFVSYPRIYKVDLYSQTKLTWNNLPYYTSEIGNRLLSEKVFYNDLFWAPNKEIYIISLAYHAVYHKKNILYNESTLGVIVDHSYTEKLLFLSKNTTFLHNTENVTNEIIHTELGDLAPNVSLLRKYNLITRSVNSLIKSDTDNIFCKGDLIVFTIRDVAVKRGKLKDILKYISNYENSFEILSIISLDGIQKENATLNTRGGIWKPGMYKKNAGNPSVLISVFDFLPDVIRSSDKSKGYPYIENRHIFVKNKIRDLINKSYRKDDQINGIHSTDDTIEALDDLKIIFQGSDEYQEIISKYNYRIKHYNHNEKIIDIVKSNTSRSKMYIVERGNSLYLKKIYKTEYLLYMKREINAYRIFMDSEFVPDLVEEGETHFITKWHENILPNMNQKNRNASLRSHKSDIFSILELFYKCKVAHLDFHPGNIMLSDEGKVRVVDFEFLHVYDNYPKNLLESYDIVGVPRSFKGDLPRGTKIPGITYNNTWRSIIGELQCVDTYNNE